MMIKPCNLGTRQKLAYELSRSGIGGSAAGECRLSAHTNQAHYGCENPISTWMPN
jgi:hypothetical protein